MRYIGRLLLNVFCLVIGSLAVAAIAAVWLAAVVLAFWALI